MMLGSRIDTRPELAETAESMPANWSDLNLCGEVQLGWEKDIAASEVGLRTQ